MSSGAYGGAWAHYRVLGEQRCLCGRLRGDLKIVADDDYWRVHPKCEDSRVRLITRRVEGDGNEV